jgi:hypothetical protein
MGFYVCPFDPRLEKLFAKPTEKLLRPRVPLAQRAAVIAMERSIPLEDAQKILYRPEAEIAGKQIRQFRDGLFTNDQLATFAICHLASVCTDESIGFWFEHYSRSSMVTFKAAAKGTRPTHNHYEPKLKSNELLMVCFTINPQQQLLRLIDLQAQHTGLAGKALAALYNLARDLRLPRIEFATLGKDLSALGFYFHLDFGYPVSDKCIDWVVEI